MTGRGLLLPDVEAASLTVPRGTEWEAIAFRTQADAQAEKEYDDVGNEKAAGLHPATLSDKPHKSESYFRCPIYISVG